MTADVTLYKSTRNSDRDELEPSITSSEIKDLLTRYVAAARGSFVTTWPLLRVS